MTASLPPFAVSVVGSWPRPAWLLDAMRHRHADLSTLQDEAVLLAVKFQEDAGVDLLTDGEQRRESFHAFVADHLGGVQLMSVAEMLRRTENRRLEVAVREFDLPAEHVKLPVAVDRLSPRRPLALDEYRFLRAHTKRAVKVTLPGPYLLLRTMWAGTMPTAYRNRLDLADDIVRILRAELQALAKEGADAVQFDEPGLAELAEAQQRRSPIAGGEPAKELDIAVALINRVVQGIAGPLVCVHVCRGNWSRSEEALPTAGHERLVPWLSRMKVGQFVLEAATPRAGSLEALKALPEGVSIGLGVVNPRIDGIEEPSEIARRVLQLREYLPAHRIHLNPDCGFGTFAERPVATARVAYEKLCSMAQAARMLRSEA